jgi:flagellar hook-basal body complex protein FliE
MADNEFFKIDKLPPAKAKAQTRTHIKDGDLHIQAPNVKDSSQVEGASFKNILSNLNQANAIQSKEGTERVYEREDVQKAMEEAANSFESMMQIQKELENAYQELRQMLA